MGIVVTWVADGRLYQQGGPPYSRILASTMFGNGIAVACHLVALVRDTVR